MPVGLPGYSGRLLEPLAYMPPKRDTSTYFKTSR